MSTIARSTTCRSSISSRCRRSSRISKNCPRADRRALQNGQDATRRRRRTFKVEGVILETENGDEYGVPFFLFSDEDLAVSSRDGTSGWQSGRRQLCAQEDQAFLVRSLAAARSAISRCNAKLRMMQLQAAGRRSRAYVALGSDAPPGGRPRGPAPVGRRARPR